jgi:hypothetical protein
MFETATNETARKQAILAGTPYIITKQFPWKLHEMLDHVDEEGLDSIVSWLPGGRAFKVHMPDLFVARIMKRFFNQTKYKSFQRQVNLWGFKIRKKETGEKGAYHHPLFLRGRKELCQEMGHQKNKFPPSKSEGFSSTGIAESTSSAGVKHSEPVTPDSTAQTPMSIISSYGMPSLSKTTGLPPGFTRVNSPVIKSLRAADQGSTSRMISPGDALLRSAMMHPLLSIQLQEATSEFLRMAALREHERRSIALLASTLSPRQPSFLLPLSRKRTSSK